MTSGWDTICAGKTETASHPVPPPSYGACWWDSLGLPSRAGREGRMRVSLGASLRSLKRARGLLLLAFINLCTTGIRACGGRLSGQRAPYCTI